MSVEAPAADSKLQEATADERSVPRAIVVPWLTIGLCLLLFVAAIVPRAAWVAYNDRTPKGVNDPVLYNLYGESIANGHGYNGLMGDAAGNIVAVDKTAYYPVGFPATVGGLKKAGDIFGWGRSDFSVKMMNGMFGAITVVLLFLLVSRMFDRRIAFAAGLLQAVFPSQIFYTGTFLSEAEFTMFLVMALLVLVWKPWNRDGMPITQLALAGVLLSAATMVRGITLVFPLLLLIIWLFYLKSPRRALLQTLVLFAGIAVLVVPWSIRNSLALDTISGPSSNLGDDLCIGNFADADGKFTITGKCFEKFEGVLGRDLEVGRNRHGTRTAIEDVLADPLRMPGLIANKAYWLMYNDDDGLWAAESYGHDYFISHPRREILSFTANGIYYATCMLVVLGGAAFALGKDIRRLFILATMLYILAVPLAFFGDPRFHFPAIPLAVVIAAWTVMTFWDRRKLARGDAPPAGGSMEATA